MALETAIANREAQQSIADKALELSLIHIYALKTLAELKLRSQELRDQQKALGKVTEENAQEYYALDNQIKRCV